MSTYQKAKKMRNKKNGLKVHKTYTYECPVTLCQSIENTDTVSLYYYAIEIEPTSAYLILLTTLPISEIPDFKLYIANKGGDWKNNEKLYKIYSEMRELQRHSWVDSKGGDTSGALFEELFSEEKVRIVQLGQKVFNKKEISVYFKYYIRFYSDVYQIPTDKIATSFFSFTEKPQGGDNVNKRTYIILPGTAKHSIDDQLIYDFLEYKKNISTMQPGESLAEKINSLRGNQNILTNVLTASIFESYYGSNAKYYYVDIVLDPLTQKAKEFIQMVMKYYQKKTYEELLEFFVLTDEQAQEMTTDFLLYEHKAEKVEFLYSFRKIDQKYGIKTDRSLPILFVQPPLTPATFDFVNIHKILSNYFSCRKHRVTLEYLANFPLISSQHLKVHPLSVSQMDLYIRVPSIMIQIERYVLVNEFRGAKKIVAHTEDMLLATSTSSYDPIRNSEPLETIGDSVLKLVTSIYLFVKQPLVSESDLTEKRIQYITNEVLMHLGLHYRVPYFLKTTKKNASEWRPPYMKHEEKIIKHELTGKQIADCVEAIIGASFLYDYSLYYPTVLLKQLGLPVYGLIINSHLIRDSSLVMPKEYIPEPSETFHENVSYYDLNQYFRNMEGTHKRTGCSKAYAKAKIWRDKYKWSEAKYASFVITSVISRFEREILQYRFKNKAYLIFALNGHADKTNPLLYQNYESLEFLGDSVIEIYVLSNAYKLFKSFNKEITPEILQNLKISLLSNAFMARIAVMNEFHRYLMTTSIELLEEIDSFVTKCSFSKKYQSFVKHELHIPKMLSDVFESLAAALLYDGGWKAVHQVLGRLFGPYISFFVHYHKKMETNIVERLKQKALAQNEFIDYKIVRQGDLYVVEIEKKGIAICKATGPTKQLAKERASYKACQLLGFL